MTQFDVVVVGSGAAALGAAATAAASGLSTLIVEKSRYWGGTTSYSGGGIWIPANPLLVADGYPDSVEEGLIYLDEIVGDVGPCSTRERRLAFLQNGPLAVSFLISEGLRVTDASLPGLLPREAGRQDRPTARAVGLRRPRARAAARHLETPPGCTALSGADRRLRPAHDAVPHRVGVPSRCPRDGADSLLARETDGAAHTRDLLVAQLMAIAHRHGAEVWLESPLSELVVDDGRVTGSSSSATASPARRGGQGRRARGGRLRPQRGVPPRYQGVGGEWSSAVGADHGDAIVAASRSARRPPSWTTPGGARRVRCPTGTARSAVGAVDARFASSSTPPATASPTSRPAYVDFGHAMLERDTTVPAIPAG